jgi:hypothetical protein
VVPSDGELDHVAGVEVIRAGTLKEAIVLAQIVTN